MSTFGARFGALISRKREERGWSFAQLAVAAYGDDGKGGESRKADVQKLETGGSAKPNAATIRKYRVALDLSQYEIDACRTPAEIELAQFARSLFDVIAGAAQAAGLTEDYALAVSERYAEGNPDDFQGALAGLKGALEDKAAERARPSNLPPDDMLAQIDEMNDAGDIDEADAALDAYMDTRRAERQQRDAEDTRILTRAIQQAVATRNPEKFADRTLELIKLDSPSAKDRFDRLRAMFVERYEHGLRHGTPFALMAGIGLARKCIDIAPTPYLTAMAQNDLGTALQQQGTRTAGPEGAALQAEAVESYRAALRVRTEADHPVQWAMTMQNLGAVLQEQGTRTAGLEGAALLADAVESYRAALRVRTEADHPVQWAMIMQNLAGALQQQGTRTAGPEGAALQAEAVDSYRAALRVRTEADHSVQWATTMQNLAGALRQQSTRTAGLEGAALLADAVDSYRAALRVYTEADHPVDWAMSMQNLGNALQEQGTRTAGPEGAALLADALESYRAALRVGTEADHPVQWAMTMQNLGTALKEQGTRTAGPEGAALLADAVDSYCAALRVRTEADHPVDWATTQENLAIAEQSRAQHDSTSDPRPHLEAALVHVGNALRIYDPEHMSYDYGTATALRNKIQAALDALPSSSS
ncbi:MAG: hypothetical protein AAF822_05660 [Pseudomonadota bacterium]